MIHVDIFTEGKIFLPFNGIAQDLFSEIIEKTLIQCNTGNVAVSVILTDNETIREINSKFLGKNKPTDVLSFAYREEPFPQSEDILEELGDIYISLEKAIEQSAEYGVPLKDELLRLIVHGVLHLLGYDHERSAADEKEMSTLEEKILKYLR